MRSALTMILLLLASKVPAQTVAAPPLAAQGLEEQIEAPSGAAAPAPTAAPDSVVWGGLPDGSSEWSVLGAGGRTNLRGVFDDVASPSSATRLALSAFQWSRVLTAPHGFRPLRGQLQMGFELVPLLRTVDARTSFGFGASPLFLRWRFVGSRHVQPYIEALTGIARTDHAIPEDTTRFNFSSKAGIGAWFAVSDRTGVLLGYRFDHVSNASRLPLNPGVDFHEIYVGLSWIRRPHHEDRAP